MVPLKGMNIAIIGGGTFCRLLLRIMDSEELRDQMPAILGISDKNMQAKGIQYAVQKGIFTTSDYRDLLHLKDLQGILVLTRDKQFAEALRKEIPAGIRLIDYFEAVLLWNSLNVEQAKIKTWKGLLAPNGNSEKTVELFHQFSNRLEEILKQETRYSFKITDIVSGV